MGKPPQPRTNTHQAKPSLQALESRQSSSPDRERKPLQHFLLFPAYKFCERKSAITRFQKKKNQERKEKPTYKRPSREAIASALPINHPSKTPTLASEQRNAQPPHQVGCPKMARLSARKPLASPWSQKKV